MKKFLLYLSLIGSFGFFSLSQDIDIANLTPSQGFKIYGAVSGGSFGQAVMSIGDINGDQKPDIIIGAPTWESGKGIVIYGVQNNPDIIDMASPPAGYGFQIESSSGDSELGGSVDNSGDVNGDGIADIVLGASPSLPYGRTNAGTAYVIFGKADGFPETLPTSSLNNGNGIKILGADVEYHLGGSVSNGGDINNDGFNDIVVGASIDASNGVFEGGTAYVIYGSSTGFPDEIDTNNFDSSLGFKVFGSKVQDQIGEGVMIGGDVNGDQIDDLLISSTRYNSNGFTDNGAAIIIFGNPAGHSDIDVENLQPGQGFKIIINQNGYRLGTSISSTGDINGDGINDIIVGAYGPGENIFVVGEFYVIYGSASGFPDTIDVSLLTPTQGFKIVSSDQNHLFFGSRVITNGDVNGDGINDIILSASSGTETVFVLFGSANGFPAVVDVNLLTPQQGYKILGIAGTLTGSSLSTIDINEDGIDDIVIGAPGVDYQDRTSAGAVYVIYGRGFCTEGYINWDDQCVEECNEPYIPRTEGDKKYCDYPCRPAQYLTWQGRCSCFCRNGIEEIINGYKFCREGSSLGDL